jgi:S-adenosylmethionine-diacylglycerol 3-amino-3-carboxypropyl transferase
LLRQASEGPAPSDALRPNGSDPLHEAVHRFEASSWEGIRERLFTFAFKGLVYPQIWEDPDVDLKALRLAPGARMITIASGGCNVLSYLTADPASIVAVDLNRAHVALTRLKLAAARHMPSWDNFYRFFGAADEKANIAAYRRFLRDKIDAETRRYWEGRGGFLRRKRITLFSRDLYHHGLLGYFIGAAHFIARLYGADPKAIMAAKSLDEQRSIYEAALAPLFDKRLVRWATTKRLALFGLGIPPAQYEALASAGGGDIASVLKQRLERLACGFSIADNYFAWQAFSRSYADDLAGPLPPYLRREHFASMRARADRVTVVNRSLTDVLTGHAPASVDAYVLLDAQDWMTDAQLNALWAEITRTALPGARVVFRTAAEPTLLPGRVDDAILSRWTYAADASRALLAEDRSAIYGGFHLYIFNG